MAGTKIWHFSDVMHTHQAVFPIRLPCHLMFGCSFERHEEPVVLVLTVTPPSCAVVLPPIQLPFLQDSSGIVHAVDMPWQCIHNTADAVNWGGLGLHDPPPVCPARVIFCIIFVLLPFLIFFILRACTIEECELKPTVPIIAYIVLLTVRLLCKKDLVGIQYKPACHWVLFAGNLWRDAIGTCRQAISLAAVTCERMSPMQLGNKQLVLHAGNSVGMFPAKEYHLRTQARAHRHMCHRLGCRMP